MVSRKSKTVYILFVSAVLILLGVSMLHTALGITYPLLVVKSGSMRPVIEVGDIIIVAPVDPLDVRPDPDTGDVIVFYRPGYRGKADSIIVHRAIARVDGGFITKGDANMGIDPWGPVPDANVVGRWTDFKIPAWTGIGFLSLFLRGEYLYPLGPVLIALLIVANVAFLLKDFLRREKRGEASSNGSGEGSGTS